MKIVFVQDSRFFAQATMKSLEGFGAQVIYASNSVECLKLLGEEGSDITAVVADGVIAKPPDFHRYSVGGADALWYQLRSGNPHRELPIVLLGDKDIFASDICTLMMACPRTAIVGHTPRDSTSRATEIYKALEKILSIHRVR